MLAAGERRGAVVEKLLAAGADVNHLNKVHSADEKSTASVAVGRNRNDAVWSSDINPSVSAYHRRLISIMVTSIELYDGDLVRRTNLPLPGTTFF